MREENTIPQEERQGGYGDRTPARESQQEEQGAGAGGRASELTDPMDADEALGNRTGGYGANPSSVEPEREGGGDRE